MAKAKTNTHWKTTKDLCESVIAKHKPWAFRLPTVDEDYWSWELEDSKRQDRREELANCVSALTDWLDPAQESWSSSGPVPECWIFMGWLRQGSPTQNILVSQMRQQGLAACGEALRWLNKAAALLAISAATSEGLNTDQSAALNALCLQEDYTKLEDFRPSGYHGDSDCTRFKRALNWLREQRPALAERHPIKKGLYRATEAGREKNRR